MNKYFNTLTNTRGDSLPGFRAQVVDSLGAIVSIYQDRSLTPFTDASNNPVNYATADLDGIVQFFWEAANGQILQTLDTAGNLINAIDGFADNFVLDNLPGNIAQAAVSNLPADLSARPTSADLASTDNGKGASLVKLRSGGTVEDVLKATYVFTPTTPQATIEAALDVDDAFCIWQAGNYYLANLTGTGVRQRHVCPVGIATIYKNANGPIWTHSGNDLLMDGIGFRGEAATYTGINFKHTGSATLFRYFSRDADQEAIVSEGRVRAFAAADIVQSDNAAYDWIIGVSGTAVLYSYIDAPYTSQMGGGIRTIDTGNTTIVGGQIGKLWVSAGTSPGGSNGGNITNVRVIGVTQIDAPNTVMTECQCGDDITLGVGASNCTIRANLAAGKKIINNGNINNNIQEYDSSASGILQINYGGKDKATSLKITPDAAAGIFEFTQQLILPYSTWLQMRNSTGSGTVNVALVYDANGSIQFGNGANASQNLAFGAGASAGALFLFGGNTEVTLSASGINLATGNAYSIDGTQVVGARGAAVADATDAASAITQLNALLARCRAHGLIAT